MQPTQQALASLPTPDIKAILIGSHVNELNDMLGKGWKIVTSYTTGTGAVFIMARNPTDIKIK